MSAFNTRTVKSPHMFVRTHVAFYFVSLLVSDILQSIGSIINAAWVRDKAVAYGTLCIAQGVIKHTADVAIALWSLVIATNTFFVLFLRVDFKHYAMWLVMFSQWSLIGAIIIAGPATTSGSKTGPFYGISGYWCWISPNYKAQRIALDYMVMFMSALLAFILYSLVYLKLRGIVHARTPSTSIASASQERNEKYEHKIARQMLLFPIAYTIMILPIAFCRFLAWTGHDVPTALTIVSDFVYLLSGLVHVILFACMRRILPPHSIFPRISPPRVVLDSTDVGDGDFNGDYRNLETKQSKNANEEKRTAILNEHRPAFPSSTFIKTVDPQDPFMDPVLFSVDEDTIERAHGPDSEHSSVFPSPHLAPRTPSAVAMDHVDRKVLPEQTRSSVPTRAQGEARPQQGPAVRKSLKHREGEEIEVPMSPRSILYYDDR